MSNFDADDPADSLDIAIVGMNARFPGARDINEYWQNLRDGVESISFFSREELTKGGVNETGIGSPNFIPAAAVLGDVDLFDASFFGFYPREAELMDPQHRLFLECAWGALEYAGYNPDIYAGLIGVFAGSGVNTYLINVLLRHEEIRSLDPSRLFVHNDKDFLATTVSYKLNLKGPSINIQTACSTSLVAVHMACQSLLNQQCDMALAGGVTIHVPEVRGYFYNEEGIASPDGHCRAFDSQARGTVGGSGVGIVVLKRLADALADGDHIHALIKGSAVNNDGALKVGYMAPGVEGQAAVIEAAQAIAAVEADSVTYVETHGTGTILGDPIEIDALTQAFRRGTQKRGFCAVGSVKTNIGHTDTAAGVAGLIKTVLALKHKLIPPSLHFTQPNPQIDFESSPFYVNAALSEWKVGATPRRAGVSSFGMGGTNAHVVLEEAPLAAASAGEPRSWHLLTLSAKTRTALDAATANLAHELEQRPHINLADVAYTLQVGRKAFGHRRMIVCRELGEAVQLLSSTDPAKCLTSVRPESEPEVVFMFPGQGAQYTGMGAALYEQEAVFREHFDHCTEALKPLLGLNLREIIYPGEGEGEAAARLLTETRFTQPALFVVEYALARLLMEWGVRPQALVGHSIGEYVAACLSEVYPLEDVLRLVATRGRLMQDLESGAMLAVPLTPDEVAPLLGAGLSLAAVNAPASCVVSGQSAEVARLRQQLSERGLACRPLLTSHAFHSDMVEPAMSALAAQAAKLKPQPPRIPYLSNVTGTWIKQDDLDDANYWARHLRRTVLFSQNVGELAKRPDALLLEVGPGQTLSSFARKHFASPAERVVLATMRHPQDPQPDEAVLLNTVGRLWLAGVKLDWTSFQARSRRNRIPLPTYPFERRRYWIETPKESPESEARRAGLRKKSDSAEWFYLPLWKQSAPVRALRAREGERPGERARRLIMSGGDAFSTRLVERFRRGGDEVVSVERGASFRRVNDSAYVVDPCAPEDFEKLFAALDKERLLPQHVLHLWSLPQSAPAKESAPPDETADFNALMFLARSLGERTLRDTAQLSVVSCGMHLVSGDERLCPVNSSLLGLCRVIQQEYPGLTCRSIDLSAREFEKLTGERLIELLLAELTTATPDRTIAYRGSNRWVQVLEAQPTCAPRAATRLKEGGTYLITGGLGNIGSIIAEHLARSVRARLVLVGRSALPQRAEWERWLAEHAADDAVSLNIQKVRALEAAGAEVLLACADAGDVSRMRAVLDETLERFGALDGVVHAAGLVGEESMRQIQEADAETFGAHLRPKAHAFAVLRELLEERRPDFLVAMSSISAILGGHGMAAYASANSYMDALCREQFARDGWPCLSVNWDGWQTRQQQQQQAEAANGAGSSLAQFSITPAEGIETFERALSLVGVVPQVVVSTADLTARIKQWVEVGAGSPQEDANPREDGAAAVAPLHPRPELQTAFVEPRGETETKLVEIFKSALGIEQLGVEDNFFMLGGDSLLATHMLHRVRETFQVGLTLRAFFGAPNVAELAALIESSRQEEEEKRQAEVLKLLEHLSDDDAGAQLNERILLSGD